MRKSKRHLRLRSKRKKRCCRRKLKSTCWKARWEKCKKSFAERLDEARVQAAEEAKNQAKKQEERTAPHIANLNEDALLTNKLYYAFPGGSVKTVGRRPPKTEQPPDIVLAGAGIQIGHAQISNMDGEVKLLASEEAILNTFVNGKNPVKPERPTARNPDHAVSLRHGDRISFGQCMFVYIDPSKGTMQQLLDEGTINYADARKEINEGGGVKSDEELAELKASRARAEELEKQVKAAEEAKAREKIEADALLKQREAEFQQKMEALQKEWEKSKAEAEAAAAQAAQQQAQAEAAAAVQAQAQAQAQGASAAQTQAAAAEAAMVAKGQAATEAIAKAAHEQAHAHQEQLENERVRMTKEFEERQKKAEESSHQRIKDLEKKAQKAAAEEEDHRQRELNMRRLEEQLMVAMPLVKEANLIAVELNKGYRLETKMQVELTGDKSRGSIHVSAVVTRDGVRVYEWALETLENRVYLMREILQQCEDEGFEILDQISDQQDPFWDPVEIERQIGVAQASLQGLLMQVENQHDCRILSTEVLGVASSRQDADKVRAPHQVGSLRVEIWPCGRDGSPGIPDDEVVDEPEELLGSKMTVLVQVIRAASLPEELANDVRVEFDFFIDETANKLPVAEGHSRTPEFNYRKIFVQDPVTSRFMEYCDKKQLVFRIYGKDKKADEMAAQYGQYMEAPQDADGQLDGAYDEQQAMGEQYPAAYEGQEQTVDLPGEIHEPADINAGGEQAAPPPGEPAKPAVPSVAQVRRDAENTLPPPPPEKKSKACVIL